MIVFQSFLAIADIHPSDNNIELHQSLLIQPAEQNDLIKPQSRLNRTQQHHSGTLHSEESSEEHPECHHGHCHHASAFFIVKASNIAVLFRQNNRVSQGLSLFTSPNIIPNLRPPIS